MIGQIKKLFPLLQRLDRDLLLRAPLLWRTRLFHFLTPPLLLLLVVIARAPFNEASVEDLGRIHNLGADTVTDWWLRSFVAISVVASWVILVISKRVGELAPSRHITTVVAVAAGSYLWLVTPTILAYREINEIKLRGPSDQDLRADYEFLTRYRDGMCVPPDNLNQLRNVLARYGNNIEPKKGTDQSACPQNTVSLDQAHNVFYVQRAIDTIRDARKVGTRGFDRWNKFYDIFDYYWWLAVAIAFGMLTAILSYPPYVWRRIFLRR
jgi:hypothetical protein